MHSFVMTPGMFNCNKGLVETTLLILLVLLIIHMGISCCSLFFIPPMTKNTTSISNYLCLDGSCKLNFLNVALHITFKLSYSHLKKRFCSCQLVSELSLLCLISFTLFILVQLFSICTYLALEVVVYT